MGFKRNRKTSDGKVHISVLGSCVSRDSFEIVKGLGDYCAEKETQYAVDRHIQGISVASAMSKPLPR